MTPQSASGGQMGLGVLSSAISGFGAYESGQEQKAAYDFNAQQEEAAIEQRTASRVGKQATAYASSGVDIRSGSPLLIMAATAASGAKQAQTEGDMLRYEGAMAAWSGTMSGIGTFLSGMSKSVATYAMQTMKPSVGGGGGNSSAGSYPMDPGMV